jgi:vesicle coat complex subunit
MYCLQIINECFHKFIYSIFYVPNIYEYTDSEIQSLKKYDQENNQEIIQENNQEIIQENNQVYDCDFEFV